MLLNLHKRNYSNWTLSTQMRSSFFLCSMSPHLWWLRTSSPSIHPSILWENVWLVIFCLCVVCCTKQAVLLLCVVTVITLIAATAIIFRVCGARWSLRIMIVVRVSIWLVGPIRPLSLWLCSIPFYVCIAGRHFTCSTCPSRVLCVAAPNFYYILFDNWVGVPKNTRDGPGER